MVALNIEEFSSDGIPIALFLVRCGGLGSEKRRIGNENPCCGGLRCEKP